jgi:hypothetical protein
MTYLCAFAQTTLLNCLAAAMPGAERIVSAEEVFELEFVQAVARAATGARAARDASRMDDADWWDANAPLLAQVFDESTCPRAVRIGAAAGAAQGGAYNAERAYQLGLRRVLDGLSVLIDQKKSTPAER